MEKYKREKKKPALFQSKFRANSNYVAKKKKRKKIKSCHEISVKTEMGDIFKAGETLSDKVVTMYPHINVNGFQI